MSEEEIDEDVLRDMGFSKLEIAKIKELVAKGYSYRKAISTVLGTKKKANIQPPPSKVEEASAQILSDFSKIALKDIEGKPYIIVQSPSGNQQAVSPKEFVDSLMNMMEKLGYSDKYKGEINKVNEEIKEIKDLIKKREEAESKGDIDNLEAKLSKKIEELENRMSLLIEKIGAGGEIDVDEIVKILNENGVLKGLMNIADKVITYKLINAKSAKRQQLLKMAVNLVKDVKDVSQVKDAMKILKDVFGEEEEEYEIKEVEEK